ncbi:MAG: hypothetical protein WBQ72_13195 [Terriglobales bacterium]
MLKAPLLMSWPAMRCATCLLLACWIPAQMLADEPTSAMLYTTGSAWVNGSEVPKSAAIFVGDMLQTRSDSSASIQANGSSVMVMADSLVKFEGPAIEIEHGGVRVTTSQSLAAHAGDVTITPKASSWTEFQVVEADGVVQIIASKGDVTVQDPQGTTTVAQGGQTTRDETTGPEKKKKKKKGGAYGGTGSIMSSPWVLYGGLAGAGGGITWVLLQHSPPASPACRTDPCQ